MVRNVWCEEGYEFVVGMNMNKIDSQHKRMNDERIREVLGSKLTR